MMMVIIIWGPSLGQGVRGPKNGVPWGPEADRKANGKNENTNSKKRLTDPLRPHSASSESLPRSTDTLQDRQRSALSGALETGSRLRAQASSEQLSVAHFFLDILDVNPVLKVSRGRAWQAAYFELDLFLPKKRGFPISFPVASSEVLWNSGIQKLNY